MPIQVSFQVKKELVTHTYDDASQIEMPHPEQNLWIDVGGFDDELLRSVGEKFNISTLVLEDISTGHQRIKAEEYPEYIFAVCKGVTTLPERDFEYVTDEIFLILRPNAIITFHEESSRIVKNVFETLKNRIRTMKREVHFTSLIFHLVFDFSVDSFYSALGNIENWLVSVRSDVLDFDTLKARDLSDVKSLMTLISKSRREMSDFRIMLTQHRDVMSLAEHGSLKYVSVEMMSDFRDIYDHTFQLIETLDSYMLRTSDVRDLYFTLRAAFTDNILRLLTIVATIFLPLTFLTGVYGMNFTSGFFQPGSNNIYAFYGLLIVMASMVGILLFVFKRRGWL